MFSVSNSESVPFLRWLCRTLSAECITISSCLCRDCHSSLSNRHHISQNCPIVMINLNCYSQYVMCCPYHILIWLHGQRSNICIIQPLGIHEHFVVTVVCLFTSAIYTRLWLLRFDWMSYWSLVYILFPYRTYTVSVYILYPPYLTPKMLRTINY